LSPTLVKQQVPARIPHNTPNYNLQTPIPTPSSYLKPSSPPHKRPCLGPSNHTFLATTVATAGATTLSGVTTTTIVTIPPSETTTRTVAIQIIRTIVPGMPAGIPMTRDRIIQDRTAENKSKTVAPGWRAVNTEQPTLRDTAASRIMAMAP